MNGIEVFQKQMTGENGQTGFHFVSAHELCVQPKPTEWLIKDYLDAGTLCNIFGESGSMKSFVALDMGLSIVTREAWHGCPVRLQGPAILIAGEGFSGLNRRIKAWSIHHGIDLQDVPFFVSDRPARFLENEGTAELIQAVDELAALHGAPVLVIIDTLNRNFGPGDENSTADMTRFISTIDESLRNRYRCTILIVHHSGLTATERARGASALRAALDWEYRLQKNGDGTRTLTCTKAKDHPEPPVMTFMPEEITLDEWIDPEDGEVMTSCVLNQTDARTDTKRLTGARKVAYDALMSLGVYVHIDAWRDAAYSSGITTSSSMDAKRKAFHRAVTDLRTAGYVDTKNDYWWPKQNEAA